MSVKLKPIPSVPRGISAALKGFLSAVKQTIEVREGVHGSGDERFLTLEELIEQGLGSTSSTVGTGPFGTNTEGTGPDMNPPSNFTVTPSIYFHVLSWDNPTGDHFSHVEIWWNTVDDVTTASLLAYVTKPVDGFKNRVGTSSEDHYYWIRAVSFYGKTSEWRPVPTAQGGPGGYKIDGKDTVGQNIDDALDVLKGGDPSAYDSGTVYQIGDLVLWNGRTWRRRDYQIGDSNIDPSNALWWERVGILMSGDVDGQPTVGVDGNLVVDDTILARHVLANQIDGTHINAQSEITLNNGGRAVFGNSDVVVDTSADGGGGKITVSPDGGPAGNDHVVLTAGNLVFKYYDVDNLEHLDYSSIKRFEAGVADHNDTVLIPGIWKEQPNVMVTPFNAPIYNKDYPVQDQTVVFSPENIQNQPGSTIRWQFTVKAYLALGSGAVGVTVNDSTTYVGTDSTPPHQTSDVITPTSGDQITELSVTARTYLWKEYINCSYYGEDMNYGVTVVKYYGRSYVRLHYKPWGGSWTYTQSPVLTSADSWVTHTFNLTGLSGVEQFYIETLDYDTLSSRFYEDYYVSGGCPGSGYYYHMGNLLVSYQTNLGESINGINQGSVTWIAFGK